VCGFRILVAGGTVKLVPDKVLLVPPCKYEEAPDVFARGFFLSGRPAYSVVGERS